MAQSAKNGLWGAGPKNVALLAAGAAGARANCRDCPAEVPLLKNAKKKIPLGLMAQSAKNGLWGAGPKNVALLAAGAAGARANCRRLPSRGATFEKCENEKIALGSMAQSAKNGLWGAGPKNVTLLAAGAAGARANCRRLPGRGATFEKCEKQSPIELDGSKCEKWTLGRGAQECDTVSRGGRGGSGELPPIALPNCHF